MFDKSEYFVNRELSWLKFNIRVMNEADDRSKPLLERLRFIAITSSNLDEFYMIRVAGLKHQQDSGINKTDAAGLTVNEQLREISGAAHELVKTQYSYWRNNIKDLEMQNICFCQVDSLKNKDCQWVENYFKKTVYPVLTPMALDAGRPFPFLANRSLNLAVSLLHPEEGLNIAVVQVPGVLPRIVEIPQNDSGRRFVFLEDIITYHMGLLFYGCTIQEIMPFRITRNADLSIDEEDAEDLLVEVERSLRQRKRGQAVRLEIDKSVSEPLREFLRESLKIEATDIFAINGPIDLTAMMKFADLPGADNLRYSALPAQTPADFIGKEELFSSIQERDRLVHHPYESFEPVVEFVRQAARDPQVLAIKQTLYRVSGNSPIVCALAEAAERGKQVTVLVELKARFDEENNIIWARRLEEAGCHVIYGLVGLKTHAKIVLVVRQEAGGIKRYIHMGTGNYNDSTAKIYTDLGLFTANDQFGADASAFFNVLSGYSDPPVWNKIVVAPLGLRNKIHALLDQQIASAKEGKPARIIAKMNSLLDKDIIIKLYEASHHGVKIDLIVRGICALRPGIKGISDNITVRSIIGRFLEHSRIFYFASGCDEKVYLSSADWMPRNLNERVELFFSVDDERHIKRIKEILDLMLKDNQRAYTMRTDGLYRRVDKRGKQVNSHEELYREAKQAAALLEIPIEQRLQPLYRKDL